MQQQRTKKLLSCYKPYISRFALVLLCAFITTICALAFPLLAKYTTDMCLSPEAQIVKILINAAIVMVIVVAIEIATNFYYDYKGHSIGAEMENSLRQDLFSHLEKLSFSYYDTHRVGEVMSRLTNDLNNLSELFHHGPEDYIMNSVKLIGALIILCTINMKLALSAFILLPVMAYATLKLNKKVRSAAKINQENIAEINARCEEAISGIRVTQAFNAQKAERESFLKAGLSFVKSRKRIYLCESYEYQVLTLLERMMYVIIIVFGAYGIYKNEVSVTDLVAFLLYIPYLTGPVKHIAWMTTQFQTGLAGFDRVMEIMEIMPDITDDKGAKPLVEVSGEVSFENVSFRYGENLGTVLNNLTLRIKPGECVAISGISGAGKTTLCALIPRFYDTESGTIKIDGKDIKKVSVDSLRNAISIVQQDTYLFSGSVIENIRYSRRNATDDEVYEAARKADADEFIRNLPDGYNTDVGPRGVKLSGGQKQRVAIARAFLRDAPILILDEATSSLDMESERAIHKAISNLRRGRTTIMIAHRLETIKDADRIIVLSDGGMAEEGKPEELLTKGGIFSQMHS